MMACISFQHPRPHPILYDRRSELIGWLQLVNILLLLIYTVECVLRFFVDRKDFFCNTWNIIDFLTAGISNQAAVLGLPI